MAGHPHEVVKRKCGKPQGCARFGEQVPRPSRAGVAPELPSREAGDQGQGGSGTSYAGGERATGPQVTVTDSEQLPTAAVEPFDGRLNWLFRRAETRHS